MTFRQVSLQYPDSSSASSVPETPIDLLIHPPSDGGHVLLGPNGCGKSLLLQAIASYQHSKDASSEVDNNNKNPYIRDGELEITADGIWHSRAVAHVSFSSHQELLREGGTASKAISEGGNLSKAAQFLVVRFGLFPLLQRDVTTLSTGEIRKVLLVRALSTRPRLLILDNAFDGLDVPSRETLKDLVSKTLLGFTMDILVQAVNANATAHTQVLLATHRSEEIVDEIETVSSFANEGDMTSLETFRRNGRTGVDLLHSALDIEGLNDSADSPGKTALNWEDDTENLPSHQTVKDWWQRVAKPADDDTAVMVRTRKLNVQRGDVTLLHDLDWTVQKGERWLVAGGNGAGKSTLSRLLARPNEERHLSNPDALEVMQSYRSMACKSRYKGNVELDTVFSFRDGVDYVSTELHMQMANSDQRAYDVLVKEFDGTKSQSSFDSDAEMVAEWLGVNDPELLSQKFVHLSQGQQKLILIASALASRSPLVVLDEPCQGLDLKQRHQVLMVVERICKSTDMSLIYITHHFEELLPSVCHVLHLKDRHDVFNGRIEDYDPETVSR